MEHGPIHLLATNLDGWSNLCRLNSTLALRDQPEESCPLDTLAEYFDGLIALSNNPRTLLEIFGDRLYVSLNDPAKAVPSQRRQMNWGACGGHTSCVLSRSKADLIIAVNIDRHLPEPNS